MCRALQLADTIACILALVHVLSALKKFFKIQSSTATAHDYPAPFIYIYTISNIAYVLSAGLPLVLMVLHPTAYQQLRHKLAVAGRLVRAVNSTVVLLSSIAAAAIARALASRVLTHQHRPYLALLLNSIQPAVFFAQQAMFIIPWRWAVPLQVLNFCASLVWTSRLPCVLSMQSPAGALETCPASTANSNSTAGAGFCTSVVGAAADSPIYFYQHEASNTCQLVHYLATLLGSLIGDVISFSNITDSFGSGSSSNTSSGAWGLTAAAAPSICEGYAAVQVLQLLMSELLFLLIPLGTIYWWEYTWKCRYLRSQGLRYSTFCDRLCSKFLNRLVCDSGSSIDTSSSWVHGASGEVDPDVSQQHASSLDSMCLLITVPVVGVYAAWSLACIIVWNIPHVTDCDAVVG